MSNAELADRLESLAAAWGPRPAGKATILEAAAALRAYVNGESKDAARYRFARAHGLIWADGTFPFQGTGECSEGRVADEYADAFIDYRCRISSQRLGE